MVEDKQRAYREKVLAEVRAKEKAISDKAKEKRKREKPYRELEHKLKVEEFKKKHGGKDVVLTKRRMIRNGKWTLVEVCELREDNVMYKMEKAEEEKWKRINAWKEKMKKAGIKPRPKKFYKFAQDLSVHTHSQCKVPAMEKKFWKK